MAWHLDGLRALVTTGQYTQATLAEAIGVSEAQVSRVLHGRSTPGIQFVQGMERQFGTRGASRLLWWDDETPASTVAV